VRRVWKVKITALKQKQDVVVPSGAEFLCAKEQDGEMQLWFKCDDDAEQSVRTIVVVGTGHDIPDGNLRYVDTVLTFGGSLVWHVFERRW